MTPVHKFAIGVWEQQDDWPLPRTLRLIDLRAELDSRIDYWRDLYGSVVLCPSPSFISNMKTPGQKMQLFRWFVDLQRQRNRLQDEMTEHFVGNSENARECFGKAAKAVRDLPLAKLRVGHILVDRTLLKFLLLELQKAGEHIFDLEIPVDRIRIENATASVSTEITLRVTHTRLARRLLPRARNRTCDACDALHVFCVELFSLRRGWTCSSGCSAGARPPLRRSHWRAWREGSNHRRLRRGVDSWRRLASTTMGARQSERERRTAGLEGPRFMRGHRALAVSCVVCGATWTLSSSRRIFARRGQRAPRALSLREAPHRPQRLRRSRRYVMGPESWHEEAPPWRERRRKKQSPAGAPRSRSSSSV